MKQTKGRDRRKLGGRDCKESQIATHLALNEAKHWLPSARAPCAPSVLHAQHSRLFVPETYSRLLSLRQTHERT